MSTGCVFETNSESAVSSHEATDSSIRSGLILRDSIVAAGDDRPRRMRILSPQKKSIRLRQVFDNLRHVGVIDRCAIDLDHLGDFRLPEVFLEGRALRL